MTTRDHQVYFITGLIVAALALAFFVFLPYLSALVVAATFAVIFEPVHRRIFAWVGRQESLAALLSVLVILVLVFAPLTLLATRLFFETRDTYDAVLSRRSDIVIFLEERLSFVFDKLPQDIRQLISEPDVRLDGYLEGVFGWAAAHLGQIFSNLANIFFNFFLILIALYYFLKDGHHIRKTLETLSPLADSDDAKILDKLETTIDSVIGGTLVVAILQGLIAGIGFLIFGVPNAFLWGFMAMIGSLIPVVGTMIVLVPAVIYVFAFGSTVMALGLLLWGVLFVGTVDNLLKPYLIERKVKIHPLLILLSVIGGIQFFGPMGFVLGPLILSFLFVLLSIYPTVVLGKEGS